MEVEHIENMGAPTYLNWPGKSRFYCKGRIMTGPANGEVYAVLGAHGLFWLGIVSMSITFVPYAFLGYINSILFDISWIAGYIIGIFLYYWQLRCQYMDPGVLFREFSYEDEEAGFPSDKTLSKEENIKAANDRIRQGAHIYKPRYCHTCHIMKPPKASHWGIWDNCVQEFDHHWTFVNNCIGRRNLKYFFLFLNLCIIWAAWFVTMGGIYLFHIVYYYTDHKRLIIVIPIVLIAFPNLFWMANIWSISTKKIIIISWVAGAALVGSITYLIPFPKIFINPLGIFFLIVPSGLIFFLHQMTLKYIYLLSRNLTEKERVSRRQYVKTSNIDDDIIKSKLPIKQCIKNIWSNLMRKNPKSVLDLAKEMNRPETWDVTDHRIEGMDRERFDSSSSSSSDELPDFLKPKPLNVNYPQNHNVLIIGVDGKILGSVPQNEFAKQNPNFTQYLNSGNNANEETKQISPIPPPQNFTFPNPQNFAFPNVQNSSFPQMQNPISPPSVPENSEDLKKNFSAKYREKLEKEKEENSEVKQKERTEKLNTEIIAPKHSESILSDVSINSEEKS